MKPLIIIFLALFGNAVKAQLTSDEEIDRDATATTPQLIARVNYPVETHYVTTEDGYILGIHRIPGSPESPSAKDKPVVLLMHGLLFDSSSWVLLGPDNSLAYLLADAGYDVWLGNARGNTYSKNHTTIKDLSSKEFWDFSWHEIGYYDLPAIIDHMLRSTGQDKITYIGYSQGTTSFYVMCTTKPEYNNKIKVMLSLAPIVYLEHTKSPLLNTLATFTNSLTLLAKVIGFNEFSPNGTLYNIIEETFCNGDSATRGLCTNLLFTIFGFDQKQLNETLLPVYLGHFPASASLRQFIHYGQEIKSKKFAQYDYQLIKNLLYYGSMSPPEYKLSLITVPIYLIYGLNDWLGTPEDVEKLNSKLSNVLELYVVPYENWNHVDFVWAIDAKKYVYDYILRKLKNN